MKVRVVARPERAGGFALAGVEVTLAPDADAAAEAIARAATDPELAVVLVEQALYDAIPRETRTRWDRLGPVVVPVPSPAWERPATAEEYILDILRQAIGYRVRLR
jgi:vacuolar-type H+-ATPase subunit F/Vma7